MMLTYGRGNVGNILAWKGRKKHKGKEEEKERKIK
jgi:hypothetical protein